MAIIDQLDQEWVELIKEARDLGISIQALREYFQRNSENLTAIEVTTPTIRHIPS